MTDAFRTFLPLDVTDEQRANLELLYEKTGPYVKDNSHFSMENFSEAFLPYHKDASECGTVACLVGHGPKVGIGAVNGETWSTYSNRVFGTKNSGWSDNLWDWVFSGLWTYVDDGIAGARARLRIALDSGVPDDWRHQRHAQENLMYDPATGELRK